MKKAILFVVALILLSVVTNAQDKGKCFDENTRLLNVGIGFSGNYYRFSKGFGYSYRNSPALSLTYEQAYPKRLGPGHLGVGAYLGFQSARSRWDNYEYKGERYYHEHVYNNFVIAARGVYHWDVLNVHNAEVYGGMIAGLRIQTYRFNTNSIDPDRNFYALESRTAIRPTFSIFAGARWYFVPKVAVFGEVGYGISYLTLGLTFKI